MLWITHAGVMRAATLLHRGARHITRADQWSKAAPGFGQWWGSKPEPPKIPSENITARVCGHRIYPTRFVVHVLPG